LIFKINVIFGKLWLLNTILNRLIVIWEKECKFYKRINKLTNWETSIRNRETDIKTTFEVGKKLIYKKELIPSNRWEWLFTLKHVLVFYYYILVKIIMKISVNLKNVLYKSLKSISFLYNLIFCVRNKPFSLIFILYIKRKRFFKA